MRFAITCLLILTFFVCVPLCAQEAAPSYQLAPEDVIVITVLKHPEFSGTFLIPPDGTLHLPGVGPVLAGGKTVQELTVLLVDRLRDRLRNPDVSISLSNSRQQRIYVLGAVAAPGIYDRKANWRITEALAAAGGLTEDPQDCQVLVMRGNDGAQKTFSMIDVLASRPEANLILEAGDVLTFTPEETMPVYVMGAVKTPGMCELRVKSGIVEALARAGGVSIPESDAHLVVMRDGKSVAEYAVTKTAFVAAVPLKRGDVLIVEPLRSVQVMVTGLVKQPGFCQLKPGESVLEALTLAGGGMLAPEDTGITVTRGGKEIATIASRSTTDTSSVTLQHGDIITVQSLRSVQVMVTGLVQKPGLCQLKPDEGLLEALALAGGPRDNAALERVKIVRGTGEETLVNIAPALLDGQALPSVRLAMGDMIVVPESTSGVTVLGYVGQPGFYPLRAGKTMTLSEMIALAKGPVAKRSSISHVALLRTTADGKQEREVVDLKEFFKTGNMKYNPQIVAGDIIFVPESKNPDWRMIFQTITSVAVLKDLFETSSSSSSNGGGGVIR